MRSFYFFKKRMFYLKKNTLIFVFLSLVIVSGCDREPSEEELVERQRHREIRKGLAKAQYNLRMISAGLEAYYFDFETYPTTLYQLTSPIAYLLRINRDPFDKSTIYRYKVNDAQEWMAWSIGPDKKDDGGDKVYIREQGLDSEGDIVYRGPLRRVWNSECKNDPNVLQHKRLHFTFRN